MHFPCENVVSALQGGSRARWSFSYAKNDHVCMNVTCARKSLNSSAKCRSGRHSLVGLSAQVLSRADLGGISVRVVPIYPPRFHIHMYMYIHTSYACMLKPDAIFQHRLLLFASAWFPFPCGICLGRRRQLLGLNRGEDHSSMFWPVSWKMPEA